MKKVLLSASILLLSGAVSAQTAITQTPKKDAHVYEAVTLTGTENVKATLTNDWIYAMEESFANFPSALGINTRGVAYANGKVYLPERGVNGDTGLGANYLHVFNPADGTLIKTVTLPSQMFKKEEGGEEHVTLPVNSIAVDSEGRLVLANLSTDYQKGRFQVWVMDNEDDQNPVKLIDFGEDVQIDIARIDAMGVYGDMKGDGYVVAPNSTVGTTVTSIVTLFDIKDGKFERKGDAKKDELLGGIRGEANPLLLQTQDLITGTHGNPTGLIPEAGTASIAVPISDKMFYIDGNGIYPTLVEIGVGANQSTILTTKDGFDGDARKVAPTATGPNGVYEFKVGNSTFLVVGNSVHGTAPENTFKLYHLQGGAIRTGAEPIAVFPSVGFGKLSNNTAMVTMPVVNVVDDETAEIYVYAMLGGFAKYTLNLATGSSVVEDEAATVKVSVNGAQINVSEEVASIEVYSVTGQKLASATNATTIAAPAVAGVYVVVTTDGVTSTSHKVIVK